MKTLLSALILSAAALGTAQAGELGYRNDPAAATQSVTSRAQVQQELAADRADVRAFNGELDPTLDDVAAGQASRAQVARDAKAPAQHASNAVNAIFVNG